MKDYVLNVDDFVAPFENFLEESIMEEDFMLANDVEFSDDENDDAEELKQDFIDEGKYIHTFNLKLMYLTQTFVSVRYFCVNYLPY